MGEDDSDSEENVNNNYTLNEEEGVYRSTKLRDEFDSSNIPEQQPCFIFNTGKGNISDVKDGDDDHDDDDDDDHDHDVCLMTSTPNGFLAKKLLRARNRSGVDFLI